MKHLPLAFFAATLVACAIDEEDFPDTYGEEWCERFLECDSDTYDDLWSSDEECQEDAAEVVELWLDLGDLAGETYDGDKGRDCVNDLNSLSCDEIEDGDHECDLWSDE